MLTTRKKSWMFVLLISASTAVFAEEQNYILPAIKAIPDLYRLDVIYHPETVNKPKEQLEHIKKQLSHINYELGKCKNENMDNEIKNLELLQEIEQLKKEMRVMKPKPKTS